MAYYRYPSSNYYRPSFFGGGIRYFPPVIKGLMISNAGMFLLMLMLQSSSWQGRALGGFMESLALYPIGPDFRIWQLITYMFMHAGWQHIIFNMIALWMFGMQLENDWGSRKFLTYYALCGVGAGISNLLVGLLSGPSAPTVGASGAIYGVLLAFGMMYPDQPIFIYFLLPIRARYFVLLFMLIELYSGISGTNDGIAHFAHLGGAAVGLVYMMVDQRKIPFARFFRKARERFSAGRSKEYSTLDHRNVSDAKYFDLHEDEDEISQERIDSILDKISQHGYQSLTEQEKKILFDAAKKMN